MKDLSGRKLKKKEYLEIIIFMFLCGATLELGVYFIESASWLLSKLWGVL